MPFVILHKARSDAFRHPAQGRRAADAGPPPPADLPKVGFEIGLILGQDARKSWSGVDVGSMSGRDDAADWPKIKAIGLGGR